MTVFKIDVTVYPGAVSGHLSEFSCDHYLIRTKFKKECASREEARKMEKQLKSTKGKRFLKSLL